jgi:hypothetical protein
MNPSYLLIHGPVAEAMARYGSWMSAPELGPPEEVAEREAIDLALEGDQWKGVAVCIVTAGPWTVLEELSGGLAGRPTQDWVRLADGGDLIPPRWLRRSWRSPAAGAVAILPPAIRVVWIDPAQTITADG